MPFLRETLAILVVIELESYKSRHDGNRKL